MKIRKKLFFRKIISPWYDSNFVCWIVIITSFVIMIFSLDGIIVALKSAEFNQYIYVPFILFFLSCFLSVKTLIRVIKRKQSD